MTSETQKHLLLLATGLFADAALIETALLDAGDGVAIQRHDIDVETMDDAAWDQVLADILTASTIVTL